ncbi:hypothetical protein ACHQM5_024838 [Ranunculus cassubicifolius]
MAKLSAYMLIFLVLSIFLSAEGISVNAGACTDYYGETCEDNDKCNNTCKLQHVIDPDAHGSCAEVEYQRKTFVTCVCEWDCE